MINKPIITLCVLAYNRPKDLENTIKSFLWQEFKNAEMLIIDDASPTDLKKTVSKWLKIDKRIRYVRNKTNLGLSENFYQSFKLCRGKYVVFLGDDDVFINKEALGEYVSIFNKYNVGILRARQIIFRNFKIFQAAKVGEDGKEKIFDKGAKSLDGFLMDATSIAGLAFLNSEKLKTLLKVYSTMYPQFELAAKMCIFYKSAQINKYLIGVGSSDGQLNVISYSLLGNKTNLLDDLLQIFERTKLFASKNNVNIISKKVFLNKIMSFLPLFLPYNTLKNGKSNTFDFIKVMLNYDKDIIFNKLFLVSTLLVIIPNFFLKLILQLISEVKIRFALGSKNIHHYNDILAKYK